MPEKNLHNQLDGLFSDLHKYAAEQPTRPSSEPPLSPAVLQTVAAISNLTATVFDTDELLQQVAFLIKDNFHLDGVAIYLLSEENTPSILKQIALAGAGETANTPSSGGQTLVNRVARTRQPEVCNNLPEQTDLLPPPPFPQAASELAVPMVIVERLVGVLDVVSAQPDHFTPADPAFFATLAAQIVVAVQNIRLLKHSEDQARRLRTLNELGEKLNLTTTLDEVFQIALHFLKQIIPADRVGIALLTDTGDRLRMVAFEGEANDTLQPGSELPIDKTALGKAVRSRAIVNISNLLQSQFADVQLMASRGFRSAVVAPLLAGERPLGTLNVGSKTPNTYTPRDEELLLHIAAFLATTIQNKRFLQQTHSALAETELLYEVSADLNTAQSYNDILNVLRRYTIIGKAQNISLNYFDQPWTDDYIPKWVYVLARHTELPAEVLHDRYPLRAFPSATTILHPDLPVIIEDIVHDPRLDDNVRRLYAQQFGAKSTIFFPLVVGGQWVGYINAIYQQPTTFPEEEVRHLMALSRQAAVAIQNQYTLTIAAQQTLELAAVNRVLKEVSRKLKLDDVLQTAYEEVQRLLPLDAFLVILYDEQSDTVSYPLVYDEGKKQKLPPRPLPTTGNLRHAIETGEQLLVNRTPQEVEALIAGEQTGPTIEGKPAASLIFVPMYRGDKITGAVSVQSYRFNAYTQKDAALLSSIAGHIAIAIENARLFEQARHRARQEQILRQVGVEVSQSTNLETILQIIARQLSHTTDAPHVVIRMGLPVGSNEQ